MAWAKIDIEQTQLGWRAEVEVGGMVARRAVLSAPDFDGIVSAVIDKYHELLPVEKSKPPPVVLPPLQPVTLPARMKPPARGQRRPRRGRHGEMVG